MSGPEWPEAWRGENLTECLACGWTRGEHRAHSLHCPLTRLREASDTDFTRHTRTFHPIETFNNEPEEVPL